MNSRHHRSKLDRFELLAKLRAERRRRGLHLIDLQEIVGYHRTTIGRWERGDDYPSIAALDDWCRALGMNLTIGAT